MRLTIEYENGAIEHYDDELRYLYDSLSPHDRRVTITHEESGCSEIVLLDSGQDVFNEDLFSLIDKVVEELTKETI